MIESGQSLGSVRRLLNDRAKGISAIADGDTLYVVRRKLAACAAFFPGDTLTAVRAALNASLQNRSDAA